MSSKLLPALVVLAVSSVGSPVAAVAGPPPPGPTPEAVLWLQEYVQIDTTEAAGEKAAAAYLAGILAAEGIASRILESPEGHASLYARLPATTEPEGGGLLLLHHLDVVAPGGGWSEEPFSGRLAEGRLWGRGAVDVKSLGIAHLAALVALHREGVPRVRDLVFLAVADEEDGGHRGAGWLLAEHPELFAGVEAVLNEGGGNRVAQGRLLWWGVEVAQKRPLWLRLVARGRGGHGSGFNPGSATHRLVTALARLVERPLEWRVSAPVRRHFAALDALQEGDFHRRLDAVIAPAGPTEPLMPGLSVYFVDTLQVTEIDNGEGLNVVAPRATATLDVRLLPETDADAYLEELRRVLGPGIEVEVLLAAPPAASSPTDHPLYRTLEATLGVRAPVVPIFIPGTTDSRWFRERGIPAYGFSPFALDGLDLGGIHAVDEAIDAGELLRGVETMRRVLAAYVGG